MGENEEEKTVEEESRRKLQLDYIHTACENVGCNFWNSAVSLSRATRMPLHSFSPLPPSSSFERPFFRFALFEACLCLVSTGVHREQTSTVWRDMELTRCFENFTSRYQTSQFWQKPSNTDGFQFCLGLYQIEKFARKFINN